MLVLAIAFSVYLLGKFEDIQNNYLTETNLREYIQREGRNLIDFEYPKSLSMNCMRAIIIHACTGYCIFGLPIRKIRRYTKQLFN